MITQAQVYISQLATRLAWPIWALESIMVLLVIITIVGFLQNFVFYEKKSSKGDHVAIPKGFRMFQLTYLTPFLVIMLADWLQGTNMYTLYSSYGVHVGTLFLTGFLSSALFGTFLGVYVDKWGRKLGCIVFCLLEVVINVLEHFPHMPSLLVGRVLGKEEYINLRNYYTSIGSGLSTSLLFSAFESWMVSEHRKLGFSEDLLASTFAISSWGNAISAIVAGFMAQVAADYSGDIGPFQLAILLTFVTLVLILPWRENYGTDSGSNKNNSDDNEKSLDNNNKNKTDDSLWEWMNMMINLVIKNPIILCVGLSQACFEGAIYTFVFMWVPSMLHIMGDRGALPTGLVFASFMLAMSIGGMLFGLLLPIVPGGVETLCILVYLLSGMAMLVPVYKFEFWWVYISFLVLEGMVGMFNSCGATLRSRYYPEHLQSTIMSLFRLPLNLLVVLGTLLTSNANNINELQHVFKVLAGIHGVAMLLQIVMSTLAHTIKLDKITAAASKNENKNKNSTTTTISPTKKKNTKKSN